MSATAMKGVRSRSFFFARTYQSFLTILTLSLLIPTTAFAEKTTKVFLNGEPAPVYFNDGDSFRVLGGRFANTKARLAGFNTLESHGPVHAWGGWTYKEMYHIAKMATWYAQKGVWHCTSDDLSTDTYGRILWYCKDLAVEQVRRGYAHAMFVGENPMEKALKDAQDDAIKNRRGMWAHGVPEFVITSTHSAHEGGGKDGNTYNRLVQSDTGRSFKWQHKQDYGECEEVCVQRQKLLPVQMLDFINVAKNNEVIAAYHKTVTDKELEYRLENYLSFGSVGYLEDKELMDRLDDALSVLARPFLSGRVKSDEKQSCMIYVDFKRRYGPQKAKCLK